MVRDYFSWAEARAGLKTYALKNMENHSEALNFAMMNMKNLGSEDDLKKDIGSLTLPNAKAAVTRVSDTGMLITVTNDNGGSVEYSTISTHPIVTASYTDSVENVKIAEDVEIADLLGLLFLNDRVGYHNFENMVCQNGSFSKIVSNKDVKAVRVYSNILGGYITGKAVYLSENLDCSFYNLEAEDLRMADGTELILLECSVKRVLVGTTNTIEIEKGEISKLEIEVGGVVRLGKEVLVKSLTLGNLYRKMSFPRRKYRFSNDAMLTSLGIYYEGQWYPHDIFKSIARNHKKGLSCKSSVFVLDLYKKNYNYHKLLPAFMVKDN